MLKPILDLSWLVIGIPFRYNGDIVVWRWPWKKGKRWLSLFFSGTGEFGDATFSSLKELDQLNKEFEEAMRK